MGTGIFSGLIWGGATGAVVVSVLSLYAPLPKQAGAATPPSQAVEPAANEAPEQTGSLMKPEADGPDVEG